MGHLREEFHVDAPAEAVWDLVTDTQRLVEWQSGLVEVKDATGKLDRVGAAFSPVFRFAGRRLEGRFEVTQIEKPNLLEMKGTSPGGGKATQTLKLDGAGPGTDISFEMDYELPGGFIGGIADKLFMERQIERDIKHSNENFKALCEAKVPAHA
jgi:carbon monoxide dehydrogenase subunit G